MSQRRAGSYSPDLVSITLGAPTLLGAAVSVALPNGLAIPHVVDGRGPDAFLSVARETASNSKSTGADGEVTISESKNRSGMFTITLTQSSTTNIVLSAMLALWETGVKFYFSITVIDLESFGSLYEADECWIQGWPEAGFGATNGTNTWVLECANLRMFHGARGLIG